MKKFINTLVFADKYKDNLNQVEIVQELIKGGYKNIEIRRDFFRNIEKELSEIAKLCEDNGVTVYYSIPDTLYKDFKLDRNKILKYLEEAKKLSSRTMKFAVGTYTGYNNGDELFLKELLSHGIKIYVENDQSFENGRVTKIKQFLDDCKAHNVEIKATFDVGNWLWAGEEPEKCAELLHGYVDYVHFKDVKIVNGKYQATLLGDGIVNYKYFLEKFKGVAIALEYPCGKEPINILNEQMNKCEI